jgi:hypothetical protein
MVARGWDGLVSVSEMIGGRTMLIVKTISSSR